MTTSQKFHRFILLIINLLSSINLLYAQGLPEVPKELILANRVQSCKVFLHIQSNNLKVKGNPVAAYKDLEVIGIQYNKNGDKILENNYSLIFDDVVAANFNSDTLFYDNQGKLQKLHNNYKLISGGNNTAEIMNVTKYITGFDNQYSYEYDSKGNCIKKLRHTKKSIEEYETYFYDDNNRKIKIRGATFSPFSDTTYFTYNHLNQCTERTNKKYDRVRNKQKYIYNKDGLLEKKELYQENPSLGRDMNIAWSVYLYSYNNKKALVKMEELNAEKQILCVTTYDYYDNGLPKIVIENRGTTIYTYTINYDYWVK